VVLDVGGIWETTLEMKNEIMAGLVIVLVDYDYMAIQCKFCLETFHHVRECLALAGSIEKSTRKNET